MSDERMSVFSSLLIKLGMLIVTMLLAMWIGWPVQEHALLDTAGDPAPQPLDPPVTVQAASPTLLITSLESRRVSQKILTKKNFNVESSAPKININHATVEELQKLPGIGEVLAQRMIERRMTHGPYKTVEDLRDVKGIGVKRLEKLRSLVVVGAVERAPGAAARQREATGHRSKREL